MPELDLSLVLPCFNEVPVIEESVAEIVKVLDRSRLSYEVIFVDDASQDHTLALAERICASDERLRLIRHPRNLGRGRTAADGMRAARGRVVGYIDIDLETPARYLIPLISAVLDGADGAVAWRIYKTSAHQVVRQVLSLGYASLSRAALGLPFHDTEAGCKFFRREAILPVLDEVEDERWFWDTEIMARAHLRGLNLVEIPTLFIKRYEVPSTVRIVPDTIDYLRKLWRFRRRLAQLRAAASAPARPEVSGSA